MNKEFFEALDALEAESGISEEYLLKKIGEAICVAAKRQFGGNDIVKCEFDKEKQNIKVWAEIEVVDEVENEYTQMTVEEAQQIRKTLKAGSIYKKPLKTKDFGRTIAQTAKHVIRQGVREAERGQMLEEFRSKNQELVSATVDRIDPTSGNVGLKFDNGNIAMLPKAEQIPNEKFKEGSRIKVFVVDVKDSGKGPRVMISRTHSGMVRRLFEQEVPEIMDGTIEIKSISREAGSRTKIAVYSTDEDVDPVGACIGNRGQRVSDIVDVLGGEKIDIIKYSEDPAEYVAAALAPSDVDSVEILDLDTRSCQATVPDDQLSLAIGNKGQNVRLAARLTGWKIDIKPASGYYEGPQAE